MKPKKALFLIVNYFNEKEVIEFVESQLGGMLNADVLATVIDNGSGNPGLLDKMKQSNEFVSVYHPEDNLGYFGAANYGLDQYTQTCSVLPDFIIICNSDISFAGDNFISELITISEMKDFDILGPDVYSDFLKYHQNPYIVRRISRRRMKMYYWLTANVILYTLFTLVHLIKRRLFRSGQLLAKEDMQVYAIHGSFMVFRKSYFDRGGSIQYPLLLFGEELFIAETALKKGFKLIFEPSLKIIHKQHATTGTFKSSRAVHLMHQSYSWLITNFFEQSK